MRLQAFFSVSASSWDTWTVFLNQEKCCTSALQRRGWGLSCREMFSLCLCHPARGVPTQMPPSKSLSTSQLRSVTSHEAQMFLISTISLEWMSKRRLPSFQSQFCIPKDDSVTVISYTWEIYRGNAPSTDKPCGIYVYLEKYLDFCHGFAICIPWQSHSLGKELCWQCKLGQSDIGPLGMLENLQNCWRINASCNLGRMPHYLGLCFHMITCPDPFSQPHPTSSNPVPSTWAALVRPLPTGKLKDFTLSI